MSVKADSELIDYLESNDVEVVKHSKNVISERLYTNRENVLLGSLIDRYVVNKSDAILDLLIGVNDAHSSILFEKMNEHMKHGNINTVCNILFAVVKKQPSWLHKIVSTSLFTTFLKFLKQENDILFIMHGILVLCILLPCVPAVLGSHQGDILEVFVRSATILLNKSGNIHEVWLLHLHVSVYVFFHRLYSMYPNNFLSYLKSNYGGVGREEPVFQHIIKPMFQFVKFHPDLITETRKSETSRDKWKVLQPHDVLAKCQKISLDPVDSVREANVVMFAEQNDESATNLDASFSSSFNQKPSTLDSQSLVQKMDLHINLSELTDMNTPPSSRPISPSNSCQDVTSITSMNKQDETNKDTQPSVLDYDLERKSSGESISGIKQTLKKTQSNSSIENFTQKPLILKTWLSSAATHSTPASPKKLTKKPTSKVNRPVSSEFFRRDMFKHISSSLFDQASVHSAPSSPMVSGSTHFNFSETDNLDLSNTSKELRAALSRPLNLATTDQGMLKPISGERSGLLSQGGSRSQSPAPDVFQNSFSRKKIYTNFKDLFSELLEKSPQNNEVLNLSESSGLPRKNSRSPLALLDEFIRYGCDIHSYQLSRIPLTSQLDTDWTYYGGVTPVDELKILQTQVNLLYVQLLYERYKCEQHCLRNRRLFGSLQKSECDITELEVLREQIILYDKKVKEVLNTAKIISDDDKKKIAHVQKQEEALQNTLREMEKNNAALLYKVHTMKCKTKEEKRKAELFQNELCKTKHQLFNVTHELLNTQPKLKKAEKLKETVDSLRKELLVQSSKQDSLKKRMDLYHLKSNNRIEVEHHIKALRKELKEQREEKELMKADIEHLKLKLREAEVVNEAQTSLLKGKESSLESIKSKHKKEIQVLEERFESSKKTCQSLQSYFTTVYAKFEDSHTSRPISTSSSSLSHTPHSSHHHSTFNAHSCNDLCRRPLTHSHHDHSHRHSMVRYGSSSSSNDNPFSRSRTASFKDDSGIERSDS